MKAKVRADPEKIIKVELLDKSEILDDEIPCDFCNEPVENFPIRIIENMAVCDICFNKYYEIID